MVGRGEDDPLVSVPVREVDHRVCRFDHYLSYPNHLILHHRYLDEDVLRARDSRFRYYRDLHRHPSPQFCLLDRPASQESLSGSVVPRDRKMSRGFSGAVARFY